MSSGCLDLSMFTALLMTCMPICRFLALHVGTALGFLGRQNTKFAKMQNDSCLHTAASHSSITQLAYFVLSVFTAAVAWLVAGQCDKISVTLLPHAFCPLKK